MTKKNEIATIERNDFAVLNPDSDFAEVIQANRGDSPLKISDLIRVGMPAGGSTTWVWEGLEGEETAKEIVGILVAHAMRGALWPNRDPSGSMPILATNDMERAYLMVDPDSSFGEIDKELLMSLRGEDGYWDWQSLPWTQWGSAGDGTRGKLAKESKLLFVLRPNDIYPLMISASAASISNANKFMARLTVPHFRAIVGLSLTKEVNDLGQPFARISMRLVNTIDQESGRMVKTLYTEPITAMCHQERGVMA